MRRKQLLLIIATILCALILSSSMTFAAGQQVRIPYVISMDGAGWWTGIAITNNSSEDIENMWLTFTTDSGVSGVWTNIKLGLPPLEPPSFIPPGLPPLNKIWMPYGANLGTIEGKAILKNSLANFYAGEGTRDLPSDVGSLLLSNTEDQEFSVTVYIGSPTGFAFQVFHSSDPNPGP